MQISKQKHHSFNGYLSGFRPFYYDLSTNEVISENSYYEIINNLPMKQFNNFRNFQGKKYFILPCNKLFINEVSSIFTVKYKALNLNVQPSQARAVRQTAGFVCYSTDLAPG